MSSSDRSFVINIRFLSMFFALLNAMTLKPLSIQIFLCTFTLFFSSIAPKSSFAIQCSDLLSPKREVTLLGHGLAFLPKIEGISSTEIRDLKSSLARFSDYRQFYIDPNKMEIIAGIDYGRNHIEGLNFSLRTNGLEKLVTLISEIKTAVMRSTNHEIALYDLVVITWDSTLIYSGYTRALENPNDPTSIAGPRLPGEENSLLQEWQVMYGPNRLGSVPARLSTRISVDITLGGQGTKILTTSGKEFKAQSMEPVIYSHRDPADLYPNQTYPMTAMKWSEGQSEKINLKFEFGLRPMRLDSTTLPDGGELISNGTSTIIRNFPKFERD